MFSILVLSVPKIGICRNVGASYYSEHENNDLVHSTLFLPYSGSTATEREIMPWLVDATFNNYS